MFDRCSRWWMGCAAAGLVACNKPPPTPAPALDAAIASAPASASASAPGPEVAPLSPGKLADADLIQRVLALEEVKALARKDRKSAAWKSEETGCGEFAHPDVCPGPDEAVIMAGVERNKGQDSKYRFLVSRTDGAIRVDAAFMRHVPPSPNPMPYATWSKLHRRNQTAVDIVNDLPEVGAFEAFMRSHGSLGERSDMGIWTEGWPEAGCDIDVAAESCGFLIVVAEMNPGSSPPWQHFFVHPEMHRIKAGRYPELVAYDTWKGTLTVEHHEAFQRLDGPFPKLERGKGKLGYGEPDKVVSNIASWGHPTKQVFDENGFVVSSVELYLGATYPVFFVEPSPGGKPLLDRAVKDPWPVRLLAHALLRANGGYPLEVAEGREKAERYRYRGRDRMFQRLVGAEWKDL